MKQWNTYVGNKFQLPNFPTLDDLASFIYESGFLIGNDSGTGHLASALEIPTLTIIQTTSKKGFRWRPGWTNGIVIKPFFKLKLKNKTYWQCFISTKKVLKAFNKFVKQCGIRFEA